MPYDYEMARENLARLASSQLGDFSQRNEATTRLQLIDRLFFECLAWNRDDCIPEESQNGKYADYTFLAPRRVLIVEAKKEGDYFELPAGAEKSEYSIAALARDYPNVKAALEQAAGYCQSRGVPFGAVCNGHQIIAFIANRSDGLPPLNGKAIVFSSLNVMLDKFLDLWQALSKPGVEEKKLQVRLMGESLPELPPKLSETIATYPGIKARNVFQTDLQNLSEVVIEDLISSRDLEARFFEECYAKSAALSSYALISKNILQARYAALFDSATPGPAIESATTEKGISAELFAEALSRRPILLIGDVGVGKTTFIRRLVKVEAAQLFESSITFYIDLGAQATLSADLKNFIPKEILRQLRKNYAIDADEANFIRKVYAQELNRFAKGIYSGLRELDPPGYKQKEIEFLHEKLLNKDQYLKDALYYIARGNRRQIILFIDNTDQRSDETQQQAFLIAQEIAEGWNPVTVFVALRPETFYRSVRMGTLSGYHPKAFTIAPPRIDEVIRKRLAFALKITRGEIPIQAFSNTVQVRLKNLESIIEVFLKSLDTNRTLEEFIDNISGGNVRLALDLVRGFFGSGYVDTQKIIKIQDEGGHYQVPLHEFLKAVIFGDAEYYDPEQSPIVNVFDVSHCDPKEHFLLPLLISLVASRGSSSADGFVDTAVIYERLQGLGFTPEQIDSALTGGVRKKLVETSARRVPQPGQIMPHALRVTTVGFYHTSHLCQLFTYIDAVLVDTPILDSEIRSSISNSHDINQRLTNVKAFQEYLDREWLADSYLKHTSIFDWMRTSRQLTADIRRIESRRS
jgi:hypothetical protein